MFNPGTVPWRDSIMLVFGACLKVSMSALTTEPVRSLFFAVPYPMNTTSSSSTESSVRTTDIDDCPSTCTVCVAYPIMEISRKLPCDTLSVAVPSASVTVPFVVPWTTTPAPASGPTESDTFTFTCLAVWENAATDVRHITSATASKFVITRGFIA